MTSCLGGLGVSLSISRLHWRHDTVAMDTLVNRATEGCPFWRAFSKLPAFCGVFFLTCFAIFLIRLHFRLPGIHRNIIKGLSGDMGRETQLLAPDLNQVITEFSRDSRTLLPFSIYLNSAAYFGRIGRFSAYHVVPDEYL